MKNRKGLKEYIEENIISQYKEFDGGHNTEHVREVIKESVILSEEYDTDEDICYTIASYHDVGIQQGRKLHHIYSANILRNDKNLRKWFNEEEIEMMAEAVEDHRASSKENPRTIYGAIVAEADRDLRQEVILRRCILYGLKEIGDCDNFELHKSRTLNHLKDKYGVNGYMKLHLNSKKNVLGLIKIREMIDSEDLFDKEFDKAWKKIKKSGTKE